MIVYGVGAIFAIASLFLMARSLGSLFVPLTLLGAIGFALYRLIWYNPAPIH